MLLVSYTGALGGALGGECSMSMRSQGLLIDGPSIGPITDLQSVSTCHRSAVNRSPERDPWFVSRDLPPYRRYPDARPHSSCTTTTAHCILSLIRNFFAFHRARALPSLPHRSRTKFRIITSRMLVN
ncbi:hypothetical protein BU24DRAFT_788 [Aaosphaeria arxii CBS 175.79]|uniref:Uncharacterized protein n=1 Tax=Aaosphaeria arxii CBS 175.79 TaxID=1450172 RepID=A0A6A5Y6G3_9PLEO|nr:uncharacterized protein BU24DRAFT_788 [Aaosphaeria arxii CBS 175.79]KAF2020400.1 hypothetical protein BU24DRAFT_788 [Aaosphaeria arxii CBS 175.79]